MPTKHTLLTLDTNNLVSAVIGPNYFSGLHQQTVDGSALGVVAVNLSNIPDEFKWDIYSEDVSVKLNFEVSTRDAKGHSLGVFLSYDEKFERFFATTATTSDKLAVGSSIDSNSYTGALVADLITIRQRPNSAFDPKAIEIVDDLSGYIFNSRTFYFVLDTDGGNDSFRNFNITSLSGQKAYALFYKDSAVGTSVRTFGQTVQPFDSIALLDTLGTVPSAETGGNPLGEDSFYVPFDVQRASTGFVTKDFAASPIATITIHQDNAAAGSLMGVPSSKRVNADGSADYTISGPAVMLTRFLEEFSFAPAMQATRLNAPISVTFSFTETDSGLNATLGNKTVLIEAASEVVTAGQTVNGVIVNAGQTLTVRSAGRSTDSVVNDRGTETIELGGRATGSRLNAGGEQDVYGRAVGTIVADGGLQTLHSGGTAVGATLNGIFVTSFFGVVPSAVQSVSVHGLADGTTVGYGGWQLVQGISRGATVLSGGWQTIDDGGRADLTAVTGGREVVLSGGRADRSTISGGGLLQVRDGGSAYETTVSFGGTLEIDGGGQTGALTINGGSLVLKAGALVIGDITFGGQSVVDRLSIAGPLAEGRAGFKADLVRMGDGDQIDLAGVAYSGQVSAVLSRDTLTVTSGSSSLLLEVREFGADRFLIGDNGRGGTLLTAIDDDAVISGTFAGLAVEGGHAAPTIGRLTVATAHAVSQFQPMPAGTPSSGGYGTYQVNSAGEWTYTQDDTDPAVQALNVGGKLTDSFTIYLLDGTPQLVTVEIQGSNDAAVVGGTTTGSVVEAAAGTTGVPSASGILTATDLDNMADTFQPVAAGTASTGGFGTYAVTSGGAWTYTLDNADATVQGLNVGATLTDTFTVLTQDGTAKVVTVLIAGANDLAAIAGTTTGSVTEAGGIANGTAGTPSATGTLTHTDPDNPAGTFQPTTAASATSNNYGSFQVSAAGVWTYTLDDANPRVNELNVGESLTDTFVVLAQDGTPKVVTVTIEGANDAAVISGTATGAVVEADGLSIGAPIATGLLTATDIDGQQNQFQSVAGGTASAGGHGKVEVSADGVWTYTLDNADTIVDGLKAGDTLIDTFTVRAEDGAAQLVRVTVNGAGGPAGASGITRIGSGLADTLSGGGDNDVLEGRGGPDALDGGGGIRDIASYEHATAGVTVDLAAPGGNTGDAAGDSYVRIESLRGSRFADKLTGDGAANVIYGLAGADTMAGGAGSDVYHVDDSGDVVTEAADSGADTVVSTIKYTLGAEIERLTLAGSADLNGTGNGLNNLMNGNGGANALFGMGANDRLFGFAGADRLDGGAGSDNLTGGDGADVFVFASRADSVNGVLRDRILDFEQGLDRIDLSGFDANTKMSGAQDFTMLTAANAAFTGTGGELRFVTLGGLYVVQGDVNGDKRSDFEIAVASRDGSPLTLNASDFLL